MSRHLPCRVGALHLAFDATSLDAIRRAEGVQQNPASDGPAGWLLDDREIPVVDLAVWFGRRSTTGPADSSRRVLIFDDPEGPKGFLVDHCGQTDSVTSETLHPLPTPFSGLESLGLRGLWAHAGHPWIVVDPRAIPTTQRHPDPLPPGQSAESSPPDLLAAPIPATPAKRTDKGRLLLAGTRCGDAFHPPVRLALSITQVLEIAPFPTLDPLPGAPPSVAGIVLWRDRPLLVLDVDRRLGWPADHLPPQDARLVVVQDISGTPFGLMTEGAPRLLRLPVDHEPTALAVPAELALGAYTLEHETILVPDLERLTRPGMA